MRRFLWLAGSAVGNLAFSLSILFWPDKLAKYAWTVKYLWMLWAILLVAYLITHEKIFGAKLKRRWGVEGEQKEVPVPAKPPASHIENNPHFEFKPHIEVSPTFTTGNQGTVKAYKPHTPSPPRKPDEPNLVLKDVYEGNLYLLWDRWSRSIPENLHGPSRTVFKAIYAQIKNTSKADEEAIGRVEEIKAEFVVNGVEIIPLPWLEESFNTVSFEPFEAKYVILAVKSPDDVGDWRVVIDLKDYHYPEGLQPMNFDNVLPPWADYEVKLNLFNVQTGKRLETFRGTCEFKDTQISPYIRFK